MLKKKVQLPPAAMIYPLPAVLVSCGATEQEYNIITIAWTGIVNSKPPMCYISVRKERHSYDIIKKNMDFAINLTTENLVKPTDWCGVVSGRKFDKFAQMQLTPLNAEIIKAPLIAESPVNIECKVNNIIELGTHDMFIADIVKIHVDEDLFDKTGKLDIQKAKLISYAHGFYYRQGDALGNFGFSVRKKKRKRHKNS